MGTMNDEVKKSIPRGAGILPAIGSVQSAPLEDRCPGPLTHRARYPHHG
jgi:hypothetical protein